MNKIFFKRFVSSIILGPLFLFLIYLGGFYLDILLSIIFILSTYEILRLKIVKHKIILIFIILFFVYGSHTLAINQNYKNYFFLLILITWFSDIGGYIFGKFFGVKKINFISPNKTYLGFFGSILFSQFLILYINYFHLFIDKGHLYKIIFVTTSSLIVIIGDLFFSYIKRINKIKDYSNILPGHGGVLDRIDGLIFLVILFNIYIFIK